MSMTAQRWWVRLTARWLARINAVDGLVQMVTLGMTAISTTLVAMEAYGYGEYALHMIVVCVLGGIAFAYLYAEGGVYNQQQRDYKDLSSNFTRPRDRMNRVISAMSFFTIIHGRPPSDEEQEQLIQVIDEWWFEFRDGVEVDENIDEEMIEEIRGVGGESE